MPGKFIKAIHLMKIAENIKRGTWNTNPPASYSCPPAKGKSYMPSFNASSSHSDNSCYMFLKTGKETENTVP